METFLHRLFFIWQSNLLKLFLSGKAIMYANTFCLIGVILTSFVSQRHHLNHLVNVANVIATFKKI